MVFGSLQSIFHRECQKANENKYPTAKKFTIDQFTVVFYRMQKHDITSWDMHIRREEGISMSKETFHPEFIIAVK